MSDSDSRSILHADLRHIVYALSDALDLVGIDDIAHGKRVGIMAAECARFAGDAREEMALMFDLGLLHDIGVSSSTVHGHLVSEFDWESSQTHCNIGFAELRDFAPLAELAQPIRHHHTHWDSLSGQKLDASTARRANLLYLVDRVDALAAPHYADGSLLMHTGHIRDQIAERAGSYFSPELVDLFLAASRSEAFWLNLETRGIQPYLNDMLAQRQPYLATPHELRQLATIFARIVDAKSPFTATHSQGVARLSRHLADRLGFPDKNCDKIEIAGLLHDLGKLRVPDEILDKPGRLDDRERTVMNTHSFETYQILRRIPGFEEIALWAAQHHEEPDGSGYPFHLHREELTAETCILRVADVFQAMVQDRPYRPGLPGDEAGEFLAQMVRRGRLDAEIVAAVSADMDAAMLAACPGIAMTRH